MYDSGDKMCLMNFNHTSTPYLVICDMICECKIYYFNGTEVELVFENYGFSFQYSLSSNKMVVYGGSLTGGWSEAALINMNTFQEELYRYIDAPGTGQYGHDWDNATYKDRNGEISKEEYERIHAEIEKQTKDAVDFTIYNNLDEAFQAYISNKGSIPASNSTSATNASESAGTAISNNASASEYILKDSSSRYLTKDDLQGFSADDCRIARNEIYARHGRKFDDEGLQSHFNSCSWYQGTIAPSDFDETMLSDIEIANKNLIVEYEKEKGYRQ